MSTEDDFLKEEPWLHELLIAISGDLSQDKFEFAVTVGGTPYDVYWFTYNFKVGQIAFAMVEGKAIIPYIKAGRRTKDEVEASIREGRQ